MFYVVPGAVGFEFVLAVMVLLFNLIPKSKALYYWVVIPFVFYLSNLLAALFASPRPYMV